MNKRILDSRKEKNIYMIKLFNLEIYCHPKVFSPKYHHTTKYIINNFEFIKGESLLEMGCGVSALSLYANKYYNCRIIGLDINNNAIEVSKRSIKKNNLKNIEVRSSDLFSSLNDSEIFDTIIWDFPFVNSELLGDDIHFKSFTDHNYEKLNAFLSQAHKHLSDKGRLILGFGSSGDYDLLQKRIKENNWIVINEKKIYVNELKIDSYLITLKNIDRK